MKKFMFFFVLIILRVIVLSVQAANDNKESPYNDALRVGIQGGVTTILHIPGSGNNFSGFGVIMKTCPGTAEEVIVRFPGVVHGYYERGVRGIGPVMDLGSTLLKVFINGKLIYDHTRDRRIF